MSEFSLASHDVQTWHPGLLLPANQVHKPGLEVSLRAQTRMLGLYATILDNLLTDVGCAHKDSSYNKPGIQAFHDVQIIQPLCCK